MTVGKYIYKKVRAADFFGAGKPLIFQGALDKRNQLALYNYANIV